MERNKKLLVVGIVELLSVLTLVLWYNFMSIVPFPPLVAVALSWFLTGSGLTVLALSYAFKS